MIKKAWNTISFLLIPVGFFALCKAYYHVYLFMGISESWAGITAIMSVLFLIFVVVVAMASKDGPKP